MLIHNYPSSVNKQLYFHYQLKIALETNFSLSDFEDEWGCLTNSLQKSKASFNDGIDFFLHYVVKFVHVSDKCSIGSMISFQHDHQIIK